MQRSLNQILLKSLILSLTLIIQFPSLVYADHIWTQSNWSGAYNGSPENGIESAIGISALDTGGAQLATIEEVVNDFEDDSQTTDWEGNWWQVLDIDPIGAYQAKGVDTFEESLVNLANPGVSPVRFDEDGLVFEEGHEPSPPTHSKDYGWITTDLSNSAEGHINIDLNPSSATIITSYNNDDGGNPVINCLFGYAFPSESKMYGACLSSTQTRFFNGGYWGSTDFTGPYSQNSVIGISGGYAYLDGAILNPGSPFQTWDTTTARIGIMASYGDWPGYYYGNQFVGNMESLIIYDQTLTEDQMRLVEEAMTAQAIRTAPNTDYAYSGSQSAKYSSFLNGLITRNLSLDSTRSYELTVQVYKDGSEVTSSDVELMINGSVPDTFEITPSSKPGWYTLNAEVSGLSTIEMALDFKTGDTMYFDDVAHMSNSPKGVLTSVVYDTDDETEWEEISWNATLPELIQVQVRTGNEDDLSDAEDWDECDPVSNGQDMSPNNCVEDGDEKIQYRVTMRSGSTPILHSISLAYEDYDGINLADTGENILKYMLIASGVLFLIGGTLFFDIPAKLVNYIKKRN